MTKDEMKGQIREIVREWWYCAEHVFPSILVDKLTDFAEPREKQIEIDAEHIIALQKQNGELTEKAKELEEERCYESILQSLIEEYDPDEGDFKAYQSWCRKRARELAREQLKEESEEEYD